MVVALGVLEGAPSVFCQLVTNNGAQITLRENVLLVVKGDLQQQGTTANLTAYDGATLKVEGNATIQNGAVTLQDGALMQVTQNMTIGSGATLNRQNPGSLEVHGDFINQGTVNNSGTVEVGPP